MSFFDKLESMVEKLVIKYYSKAVQQHEADQNWWKQVLEVDVEATIVDKYNPH